MSVNAAIRSHLASGSALTALVDSRIYALSEPEAAAADTEQQKTVVYARRGLVEDRRGVDGSRVLAVLRYGIWSAASVYDDAHEVADALVARMVELRAQMVGGVFFKYTEWIDSLDDSELTDIEHGVYVVYNEFQVHFK